MIKERGKREIRNPQVKNPKSNYWKIKNNRNLMKSSMKSEN